MHAVDVRWVSIPFSSISQSTDSTNRTRITTRSLSHLLCKYVLHKAFIGLRRFSCGTAKSQWEPKGKLPKVFRPVFQSVYSLDRSASAMERGCRLLGGPSTSECRSFLLCFFPNPMNPKATTFNLALLELKETNLNKYRGKEKGRHSTILGRRWASSRRPKGKMPSPSSPWQKTAT